MENFKNVFVTSVNITTYIPRLGNFWINNNRSIHARKMEMAPRLICALSAVQLNKKVRLSLTTFVSWNLTLRRLNFMRRKFCGRAEMKFFFFADGGRKFLVIFLHWLISVKFIPLNIQWENETAIKDEKSRDYF